MKSIIKYISLSLAIGAFSSCSDFEDINNDPTKASEDQVKVEYFINKSIIAAQQEPYYGERVFTITWKSLARQHPSTYNVGLGNTNDEFIGAYFSANAEWQNAAQTAITLADKKMENGSLNPNDKIFAPQAKQVARIWKAYLMAEFIDMFGVTSIDAFKGYNPDYNSAEEGYMHVFKELTEAVEQLEKLPKGGVNQMNSKLDAAYGFDFEKWIQYANSLRMRYAMRISKVAPQEARKQFDAAIASGKFIKTEADNFWVQEKSGWSDLTGVMSRGYVQQLSSTMNNIYLGLGGVKTEKLVADSLKKYIKGENYLGLQLVDHYTKYTNDPMNGFWLDGLPNTIDPRAIATFYIPGEYTNPNNWYEYSTVLTAHKQDLLDPKDNTKVLKTINAKFHWNGGRTLGSHGAIGALNKVDGNNGTTPGMVVKYRDNSQKRLFFPSWESYFLLAEASLEWGGSFGGHTAESAYNEAIKQNFAYNGVSQFVDEYLASEAYNRVGTSVKWSHTTEPSATVQMDYVNGYTGVAGTYSYKYPEASKTLYGKALNDQYVKLYTQKYLANMPYMPMEAWSDQRKMGLPFFETPAAEQAINTMPTLNQTTVFEKQLSTFFPQRAQFPSKFRNSSAEGYKQAVGLLNGEDNVYTKIWWANY